MVCFSCGYDLRGNEAALNCPECGYAVADTRRGIARQRGKWSWKVRLGILLLLWSLPALILSAVTFSRYGITGLPLMLLNFPGPKLWGGPLLYGPSSRELFTGATGLMMLVLNTFGVWLLAAPDPATASRERALSLRQCLRCHAVIGVAFLWLILWGRTFIQLSAREFYPLAILLLIELPGTLMLYLYLMQLSTGRLRDPQLHRRARMVLIVAMMLQAISIIAVNGIFPMQGIVFAGFSLAYTAAAVGTGLYAADLMLDLYRAIADAPADAAI